MKKIKILILYIMKTYFIRFRNVALKFIDQEMAKRRLTKYFNKRLQKNF